jgi:hypothetical protein
MLKGSLDGGNVFRLRKLAVIASALLALGGTALVSAGPASADTGAFTNNNAGGTSLSAWDRGTGLVVYMVGPMAGDTTFIWHPNDATTEIRAQDSQDCMQVVPSESYEVRMAVCDGGTDQMFIPNPVSGGHEFISDSHTNLCLNDDYNNPTNALLNATTCNSDAAAETDQTFFSG